jgi:putative SOS response-associated peptidase YedK
MCGRFVLTADGVAIQQHFDLTSVPDGLVTARYNIAPTQPVPVITNEDPTALTAHRWGLIPSWAKDPAMGNRLINARGETVHEKPSFRSAFKRRRCLIPANGFYEWKREGKTKRPYYIHLKDQALFAFAGLWEVWHSPDGGELRTCTIITTEPNDVVGQLHNRMAVILAPDDYDQWLSPDELPPQALLPLLQPYDASQMDAYEVSTRVNSPTNDDPTLIEPLASPLL